jgi:hypothetical protein
MSTPTAPEYESIESFVQYVMDEEQDQFTHEDLGELAYGLQRSRNKVRADLESYGLKLAPRAFEKRTRGFTTSSNDRWFGPGSSPMHGGSGWEQINGFAGQKG